MKLVFAFFVALLLPAIAVSIIKLSAGKPFSISKKEIVIFIFVVLMLAVFSWFMIPDIY
jgi:hypothetical protein